jgi:hypothetical protein
MNLFKNELNKFYQKLNEWIFSKTNW